MKHFQSPSRAVNYLGEVEKGGRSWSSTFYFRDIEKDGGQINREVIWVYNTFGYIPGDDTYERILLDRYLSKQ